MSQQEIIQKTIDFVKEKLDGEGTGHDWWHIHRVYKNALFIAQKEGGDSFIVELAALLHDIADWKFQIDNEDKGAKIASQWLVSMNVNQIEIDKVCRIINEISFKGAGVSTPMSTIEGQIVQDADRLDAIGAIGIARAFAYGGYKNRELYNPDVKPQMHQSFEEYKKSKSHTINHFYEKLLLLKDLFNTETAKQMANDRHQFMESYLAQFYKEWNVEG